ncbi:hypothetical protein, partial [Streptomyces sp. SID5471]|uniref:hypothetical protein n=1 Tax=Streptomyces sp. SID5471 TaxID=2690298 RepID=UPI001F22517E
MGGRHGFKGGGEGHPARCRVGTLAHRGDTLAHRVGTLAHRGSTLAHRDDPFPIPRPPCRPPDPQAKNFRLPLRGQQSDTAREAVLALVGERRAGGQQPFAENIGSAAPGECGRADGEPEGEAAVAGEHHEGHGVVRTVVYVDAADPDSGGRRCQL